MRPDPTRSYVRDLLETMTGVRPDYDADGDLPVAYEGAQFYVRVQGEDAVVQVFAVVLADVEISPGLLGALNGINAESQFARAFHVADQVLIEHEIWADDVNPANFGYACRAVAAASDRFGRQLHESFGGTPRFENSKTPEYSPPPTFGFHP